MDELNINWDEIPASDEYSLEEILLQFRSEEQVMEVDRPEVKVEKTETKAEVQTGPEAEVPTGAEVEEKSEEKVEASVWEKFRTRAAEKPAPRTEEKAGIKAEPKADTGIWEKFRTKVAEKPAARTEQKAEPKEKPRKKKPEKKAEKESSRHLSAPKVRESFPPENSAELPDPEEVLSLFKTFVEEAPPSDHTEVSPVQSEEKPLLAEDSPDFRDILREFMMGDQHPLYRETTGMAYREPEAAEPEEEEEEKELVLPEVRPRKTYPVEEFFPAENESPEEPESEPSLPEPEPESPEEPEEPEESGDFDEAEQPQEPEASEGEVTVESDEEDSSEEDDLRYLGDFPPFGQWILNELTGYWIKLNGIGNRESTHTMEDDKEDPGPEVNVAVASRYYGSQVTMLRMRFQIGLALLAVLAWITLGFPVSGMLKTVKTASMMCLGLQLVIMLLCLDIITNALINLTRGKFGADALALLACIVSSLDALAVTLGGFGTPHLPLCLLSSLSLMGILLSSLLSARALRKSLRVPAIGRRAYCVTAEEGVRGSRDVTLLKSVRPTAGFVRRAEEAPPDETLYLRYALPALLAAVVLSLLTALIRHAGSDLLYILSAMLSCLVPVTALLAFALPFFIGSQRIFSSGAAIAGWSGIHDIGFSRNLIVTDRDLFPEDTLEIDTVRVFADESAERVIAYAGTMIAAAGSGLGPCFADLMEKNSCRMRQVEDFQWLSGGGLQGHIEGHTVLCGSSDLLQLMNVAIPYRLVDRTTVLLAIDGVLYGIFKVNYTGLPEVRTALQELIASNRHPIFAIRDFCITPEMLHDIFGVATDGYDFPPYGERFRLSEAQPSENSKVAAVVCREGLGPLTHLADTGRSMFVAVRLNLLITIAVAVLGMFLVFLRLVGTGLLSPWLPFVLMLLDAIAVTLISVFMRF